MKHPYQILQDQSDNSQKNAKEEGEQMNDEKAEHEEELVDVNGESSEDEDEDEDEDDLEEQHQTPKPYDIHSLI